MPLFFMASTKHVPTPGVNYPGISGAMGPGLVRERYHQIVYSTPRDATTTCRSVVACRERLTWALKELAKEIGTPGTELNLLVTRQRPR
jgi:hypothetical protein